MKAIAALRPSLTDLLGFFLASAVVLIGGTRLFGDSDPAMHVATGNWILEHGRVPRADPFSATHAAGEWFAHEWLAGVAFAAAHRVAGWPGLVALSAALIALAHVIVYRFLVRRAGDAAAAFVAVVAAAAAAASHWLARPHLFTILCLAAWVVVLESVAAERAPLRRLAWLPPSMVLWANLHGGFLAGLLVVGCYAAGETMRSVRDPARRRRAGALGLALAACAAASLANPWGIRLPAHLLAYFASPRVALALNEEFAPASLSDRAGVAALAFMAAGAAAIAGLGWARLRAGGVAVAPGPIGLHPGTILAFAASAAMTLVSIRHVEVMSIVGAVAIAVALAALVRARLDAEALALAEALRAREARCGGGLLAAALIALGAAAAAGAPLGGYDPAVFPVRMIESLRGRGIRPEGAVIAPDWWGGYLVLEWPGARPFVDGRSDMFGDAFMALYARTWAAEPGWAATLERASAGWALLPPGSPLARALEASEAWERWGADETAIAFRRRAAPAGDPSAPSGPGMGE